MVKTFLELKFNFKIFSSHSESNQMSKSYNSNSHMQIRESVDRHHLSVDRFYFQTSINIQINLITKLSKPTLVCIKQPSSAKIVSGVELTLAVVEYPMVTFLVNYSRMQAIRSNPVKDPNKLP